MAIYTFRAFRRVLVCHVVTFIQIYHLLCYHVYDSYSLISLYHIQFCVFFQMHAYVMYFYQDSTYLAHIAHPH